MSQITIEGIIYEVAKNNYQDICIWSRSNFQSWSTFNLRYGKNRSFSVKQYKVILRSNLHVLVTK